MDITTRQKNSKKTEDVSKMLIKLAEQNIQNIEYNSSQVHRNI